MESIQGLVEHIVYHNDTNGYTVFSLMCQGEEIVCVGNVTSLDEGEYLKAEGEYTEHQVYGRQFKVTSMSVEVPEDEYSIERYLGSGAIRGVGPSLAARIVKKFKKDSFRIIEEEPERLAEIKGISERKAREIYQQFHEKQDMRQAMMFLAKYGITTTLSLRIYKQYGEEMYRIIQENPYRLADDMNGIGFKLADEIAKKAGIGSHSEGNSFRAYLHTGGIAGGEDGPDAGGGRRSCGPSASEPADGPQDCCEENRRCVGGVWSLTLPPGVGDRGTSEESWCRLQRG